MEPRERKRGYRDPDRHLYLRAMNRASTYIHGIEAIKPGMRVWLWCRVSTKKQFKKGNHLNQESAMRAAVQERGGEVVGCTHCDKSCNEPWDVAEARLYQASLEAERAGAVLLAAVTSRYVRHPDFKSRDKDGFYEDWKASELKAGHEELSGLSWVCGPVVLLTLLDPDATNVEETNYLSSLNKKGGRPKKSAPEPMPSPGYKKLRYEVNQPEAIRLHVEGMPYRAIGRTLGIAESTVRSWVRSILAEGKTK